jgi:hypothetical protein
VRSVFVLNIEAHGLSNSQFSNVDFYKFRLSKFVKILNQASLSPILVMVYRINRIVRTFSKLE